MKWVALLLFVAVAINGLPALNLDHSQGTASETGSRKTSKPGFRERPENPNGGNTRSVDSFGEYGNQNQSGGSFQGAYGNVGLGNGGVSNSQSGFRSTGDSKSSNTFKKNQRAEEGLQNAGRNQHGPGQYNFQNLLSNPRSPKDFQPGPVHPIRHTPVSYTPNQGNTDSLYNQNRNYGNDNGNYGNNLGNYGNTPSLGSHDGRHINGIWNRNDQLLRRPQINNHFNGGNAFERPNPADFISPIHGIDIPGIHPGNEYQPSNINDYSRRVPNQIQNQAREDFSDTLRQGPNTPHFSNGIGNQGIDSGKYLNGIPLGQGPSSNTNEYLNGLLNHARAAVTYPGPINPGNSVNRGFFQGGPSNANQYPIEGSEDANTRYISDILSKAQYLLKHGALPNSHGITPPHHHSTPIIEPVYELPNPGVKFYETPIGSYMANPSSAVNDDGFREVVPEYVVPAIIVPEPNPYPNGRFYTPNYGGVGPVVEYLPSTDAVNPNTIFGRNPAYGVAPVLPISTGPVNNDRPELLVDRTLTYAPLPPLAPVVPMTPLTPVTPLDNFIEGNREDASDASANIPDAPIDKIPDNNDRTQLLFDRMLSQAPLLPLQPVVPLSPLTPVTTIDNANDGTKRDASDAPLPPVTTIDNVNEGISRDASLTETDTDFLSEYDTTYGPSTFNKDLKYANTHGARYPDDDNEYTSADVNDGLLNKPVTKHMHKNHKDNGDIQNLIATVTENNESTVDTEKDYNRTYNESAKKTVFDQTENVKKDEGRKDQTIERLIKDLNKHDRPANNEAEIIKNSEQTSNVKTKATLINKNKDTEYEAVENINKIKKTTNRGTRSSEINDVDDDNDSSTENGKSTEDITEKNTDKDGKDKAITDKTVVGIKKDSSDNKDKEKTTKKPKPTETDEDGKYKSITDKGIETTKNNPENDDSTKKQTDKNIKSTKPIVIEKITTIENTEKDKSIKPIVIDKTTKKPFEDGNDNGKIKATSAEVKNVSRTDDKNVPDKTTVTKQPNNGKEKIVKESNDKSNPIDIEKGIKGNVKHKQPATSIVDKANQIKSAGRPNTINTDIDNTTKNNKTTSKTIAVDKTTVDENTYKDSSENKEKDYNVDDDSYEDEVDDEDDASSETEKDIKSKDGKNTLINKKPVIGNKPKKRGGDKKTTTEIKKASKTNNNNATDKSVVSKKSESKKEITIKETKKVLESNDKSSPLGTKDDKTPENDKPIIIHTTTINKIDKSRDENNKPIEQDKGVFNKDDQPDAINKNGDKNTKPDEQIVTGNNTGIKTGLGKDVKGNDKNKKPAKSIVDKANQIKNTGRPNATDKKIDYTIEREKTAAEDKTTYKDSSKNNKKEYTVDDDDDDSYDDEIDDDDVASIETDKDKQSKDGKYTLINKKTGKDNKPKNSDEDDKIITDKTTVNKNPESEKEKTIKEIKKVLGSNDNSGPIDTKNDKTPKNSKPNVVDTIKTIDKNNKPIEQNKTILNKDDEKDKNSTKPVKENNNPDKQIVTGNITGMKIGLGKDVKGNDKNKKPAKSIVDKANQIKNTGRPIATDKKIDDTIEKEKTAAEDETTYKDSSEINKKGYTVDDDDDSYEDDIDDDDDASSESDQDKKFKDGKYTLVNKKSGKDNKPKNSDNDDKIITDKTTVSKNPESEKEKTIKEIKKILRSNDKSSPIDTKDDKTPKNRKPNVVDTIKTVDKNNKPIEQNKIILNKDDENDENSTKPVKENNNPDKQIVTGNITENKKGFEKGGKGKDKNKKPAKSIVDKAKQMKNTGRPNATDKKIDDISKKEKTAAEDETTSKDSSENNKKEYIVDDDGDNYEDEIDDDDDASSETDQDKKPKDGKYTLINKKPGKDNKPKNSDKDEKVITDKTTVNKNPENEKEETIKEIKKALESNDKSSPIDTKDDKTPKNSKPNVVDTIKTVDKNNKPIEQNKTILNKDDEKDKNSTKPVKENNNPDKQIVTGNIAERKKGFENGGKRKDKNKKPATSIVDKANRIKNTSRPNAIEKDKTAPVHKITVDETNNTVSIENNKKEYTLDDDDDSYEDEIDDDDDDSSEKDQHKKLKDGKYTLINKKPGKDNKPKNSDEDDKIITDKTTVNKNPESEKEKTIKEIKKVLGSNDNSSPIDTKDDKTPKNSKPNVVDTIKTVDKNNKPIEQNKTILNKGDDNDKNSTKPVKENNNKPDKKIVTGNITENKKGFEKGGKGKDKNKKPATSIIDKANQIKNTGKPNATDKRIDDTLEKEKNAADDENNKKEYTVDDDDDSYEDEIDDDDDASSETDQDKKSKDGKYTLINKKPGKDNKPKNSDDGDKIITDKTTVSKNPESEKEKTIKEIKKVLGSNDKSSPIDTKDDKSPKNSKPNVVDTIKTIDKNNKPIEQNKTILNKDDENNENSIKPVKENNNLDKQIVTGNIAERKKGFEKGGKGKDKNKKPATSIVDKAKRIKNTSRPNATEKDKTAPVDKITVDETNDKDSIENNKKDYAVDDDDDSYEDEIDDDDDVTSGTDKDKKPEGGKYKLINKKPVKDTKPKNSVNDEKTRTEIKKLLKTNDKNGTDKNQIIKKPDIKTEKTVLGGNDKSNPIDSKDDKTPKNSKPTVIDTTTIKNFDKNNDKNNKPVDKTKTILQKDDQSDVNENKNTYPVKQIITGKITFINKGLEKDDKGNDKNKKPVKSIVDKANQIKDAGRPNATDKKNDDTTEKYIVNKTTVDETTATDDDDSYEAQVDDDDGASSETDQVKKSRDGKYTLINKKPVIDTKPENSVDDKKIKTKKVSGTDANNVIGKTTESEKEKTVKETKTVSGIHDNSRPIDSKEDKPTVNNTIATKNIDKNNGKINSPVEKATTIATTSKDENGKEKSTSEIKKNKVNDKPSSLKDRDENNVDKIAKKQPLPKNNDINLNSTTAKPQSSIERRTKYNEKDVSSKKPETVVSSEVYEQCSDGDCSNDDDDDDDSYEDEIDDDVDALSEKDQDKKINDGKYTLINKKPVRKNQVDSKPKNGDGDEKTITEIKKVSKANDKNVTDKNKVNKKSENGKKKIIKEVKKVLESNDKSNPIDSKDNKSTKTIKPVVIGTTVIDNFDKDISKNNKTVDKNQIKKPVDKTKPIAATYKDDNIKGEPIPEIKKKNVDSKPSNLEDRDENIVENRTTQQPVPKKDEKDSGSKEVKLNATTAKPQSKNVEKEPNYNNNNNEDNVDKPTEKQPKPKKNVKDAKSKEINSGTTVKEPQSKNIEKEPNYNNNNEDNVDKPTGKQPKATKKEEDAKKKEVNSNVTTETPQSKIIKKGTKYNEKHESVKRPINIASSEEDGQCSDGDCDNDDDDDSYEDEVDDENGEIHETDNDKNSKDEKYKLINKKPVVDDKPKNSDYNDKTRTETKKVPETDANNITDKTIVSKKPENDKEKTVKDTKKVSESNETKNQIDSKNDKTVKNDKPIIIDAKAIKNSDESSIKNNKKVEKNEAVLKKDDKLDVIDDKNIKPVKPIVIGNITGIKKGVEKDNNGNDKNKKPATSIVDKANQIRNVSRPNATDKKINDTTKKDKTTNKSAAVVKTANYKIGDIEKDKISEDGKFTLINKKPVLDKKPKNSDSNVKTITEIKKVSETDNKNVTDKPKPKNIEIITKYYEKDESIKRPKNVSSGDDDQGSDEDYDNDDYDDTDDGNDAFVKTDKDRIPERSDGKNKEIVTNILKEVAKSKQGRQNDKTDSPDTETDEDFNENKDDDWWNYNDEDRNTKTPKTNGGNTKKAKGSDINQKKKKDGSEVNDDSNDEDSQSSSQDSRDDDESQKAVSSDNGDQNENNEGTIRPDWWYYNNEYRKTKVSQSNGGKLNGSDNDDDTRNENYDDDDDDEADLVDESSEYGSTKDKIVRRPENSNDSYIEDRDENGNDKGGKSGRNGDKEKKEPTTIVFERASQNENNDDQGDLDWWYHKNEKAMKPESIDDKDKQAIGSKNGDGSSKIDRDDKVNGTDKSSIDAKPANNARKDNFEPESSDENGDDYDYDLSDESEEVKSGNNDENKNKKVKVSGLDDKESQIDKKEPTTIISEKASKNKNNKDEGDLDWWYYKNENEKTKNPETNDRKDKRATVPKDGEGRDDKIDGTNKSGVDGKSGRNDKNARKEDFASESSDENDDDDDNDFDYDLSDQSGRKDSDKNQKVEGSRSDDKESQIVKKEPTTIVSEIAYKNEKDNEDWWYYSIKEKKDKKAIVSENGEASTKKDRDVKVDGTKKSSIDVKPARNINNVTKDDFASESSDEHGENDDDADDYEDDLSDESGEADQSGRNDGTKNQKVEASEIDDTSTKDNKDDGISQLPATKDVKESKIITKIGTTVVQKKDNNTSAFNNAISENSNENSGKNESKIKTTADVKDSDIESSKLSTNKKHNYEDAAINSNKGEPSKGSNKEAVSKANNESPTAIISTIDTNVNKPKTLTEKDTDSESKNNSPKDNGCDKKSKSNCNIDCKGKANKPTDVDEQKLTASGSEIPKDNGPNKESKTNSNNDSESKTDKPIDGEEQKRTTSDSKNDDAVNKPSIANYYTNGGPKNGYKIRPFKKRTETTSETTPEEATNTEDGQGKTQNNDGDENCNKESSNSINKETSEKATNTEDGQEQNQNKKGDENCSKEPSNSDNKETSEKATKTEDGPGKTQKNDGNKNCNKESSTLKNKETLEKATNTKDGLGKTQNNHEDENCSKESSNSNNKETSEKATKTEDGPGKTQKNDGDKNCNKESSTSKNKETLEKSTKTEDEPGKTQKNDGDKNCNKDISTSKNKETLEKATNAKDEQGKTLNNHEDENCSKESSNSNNRETSEKATKTEDEPGKTQKNDGDKNYNKESSNSNNKETSERATITEDGPGKTQKNDGDKNCNKESSNSNNKETSEKATKTEDGLEKTQNNYEDKNCSKESSHSKNKDTTENQSDTNTKKSSTSSNKETLENQSDDNTKGTATSSTVNII